jgi:prepilin-type N-terminal cleavage/methylation domain-containing protein
MRLSRIDGFTLQELLLTLVIMAIVTLAFVRLSTPVITFFQRSPIRQTTNMELRSCMGMIQHVMSNGRASTLIVATPNTTPAVQFSSATFQSMDGASYTITWSNNPPNTVHLQKTLPGSIPSDTILASHVTGLVFGMSVNDPGIVTVTIRMTIPFDASGAPGSVQTLMPPPQIIRMLPT